MKPIQFEEAKTAAMAALAVLRSSESTRLQVVAMLECMEAAYQARTLACSDNELAKIRAGADQVARLKRALTEKEIKSVGLFVS